MSRKNNTILNNGHQREIPAKNLQELAGDTWLPGWHIALAANQIIRDCH
ncbi:MAG: hypothetical protein WCP19_11780 [Chloroflexota bacterium]